MVRIEWGYQFKTQPREHPTEETIKRKAQSCHDDDSVRHCVEAHCRLNIYIYIYNTQHAYILYMRMLCRRCVCIRHGNHSIDTNNRRYIKLLERIAELFFLYSFFYSTLFGVERSKNCWLNFVLLLSLTNPVGQKFWWSKLSFSSAILDGAPIICLSNIAPINKNNSWPPVKIHERCREGEDTQDKI